MPPSHRKWALIQITNFKPIVIFIHHSESFGPGSLHKVMKNGLYIFQRQDFTQMIAGTSQYSCANTEQFNHRPEEDIWAQKQVHTFNYWKHDCILMVEFSLCVVQDNHPPVHTLDCHWRHFPGEQLIMCKIFLLIQTRMLFLSINPRSSSLILLSNWALPQKLSNICLSADGVLASLADWASPGSLANKFWQLGLQLSWSIK